MAWCTALFYPRYQEKETSTILVFHIPFHVDPLQMKVSVLSPFCCMVTEPKMNRWKCKETCDLGNVLSKIKEVA